MTPERDSMTQRERIWPQRENTTSKGESMTPGEKSMTLEGESMTPEGDNMIGQAGVAGGWQRKVHASSPHLHNTGTSTDSESRCIKYGHWRKWLRGWVWSRQAGKTSCAGTWGRTAECSWLRWWPELSRCNPTSAGTRNLHTHKNMSSSNVSVPKFQAIITHFKHCRFFNMHTHLAHRTWVAVCCCYCFRVASDGWEQFSHHLEAKQTSVGWWSLSYYIIINVFCRYPNLHDKPTTSHMQVLFLTHITTTPPATAADGGQLDLLSPPREPCWDSISNPFYVCSQQDGIRSSF